MKVKITVEWKLKDIAIGLFWRKVCLLLYIFLKINLINCSVFSTLFLRFVDLQKSEIHLHGNPKDKYVFTSLPSCSPLLR